MDKTKNEKLQELRCSFCGKGQEQVQRLIAGPEVYICDECVALCNEIIAQESVQDTVDEGRLLSVITSYSIHYTKLYEDRSYRHCGQGELGWARRVGGHPLYLGRAVE